MEIKQNGNGMVRFMLLVQGWTFKRALYGQIYSNFVFPRVTSNLVVATSQFIEQTFSYKCTSLARLLNAFCTAFFLWYPPRKIPTKAQHFWWSGAEKFQSPSENLYPNGHTLGIVLLQPSLCTAELNRKVEVAGSIFCIYCEPNSSASLPLKIRGDLSLQQIL